jgi:endonuclease YncB( thermonuclease family)
MNAPSKPRYWRYEYTHIRVIDGDTIVGDIDQGMSVWSRNKGIRFAGINAHEHNTPDGQAATQFLNTLIIAGDLCWIVTTAYHEFEKYGRVLAYIYTDPADIDYTNLMTNSLNETMVETGHAFPYSGEGPKP